VSTRRTRLRILQNFDTPGELRWAWNIKGKVPGDYSVALQLRPAVAVRDGGYVVPAGESPSPTTTFTTQVSVTGTALEQFYAFWDKHWPKIVPIVTTLGAALLGVRAWFRKLRRGDEEEQQSRASPAARTSNPARTVRTKSTKKRR
jgi:hypothetical protein